MLAYLLLWLVMPGQREIRSAPGLESHSRTGLRPRADGPLRPVDLTVAAALALVGCRPAVVGAGQRLGAE